MGLRFCFTVDKNEIKTYIASRNTESGAVIATVHVLHPQPTSLAGYLRIGHTGQRQLEALHAAGRFPFRRVVFDAAHIAEQAELLKALRRSGCEIVLDPNFAEMATAGRYASSVKNLPWANPNAPWKPSDFGRGSNFNPARLIADFAVNAEITAVLAPTHVLESVDDEWKQIDLRFCEALRRELDRIGGNKIAIDYQLMTTYGILRESVGRDRLTEGLADLPIQNVWWRISGFGATATGAGTRQVIEAARSFHDLPYPFIVDFAGGFAGLATLAFGGFGGMAHGGGQRESFSYTNWKKGQSRGGGAGTRIYIPELDRYLNESQLQVVFAARGGRSKVGCPDTSCCPNGPEDMIENAHAHFLIRRSRQLDDLSKEPDLRRAEHFLLQHVDPSVRASRQIARLALADENVREVLKQSKARLIRFRDALADLRGSQGSVSRAKSPAFRGGAHSVSALLGR